MKKTIYKNISIYSLITAIALLIISIFLSSSNNADGATILGIISSLCCIVGLFFIFKLNNKKQ